jgi:hypothetical protein
MNIERRAQSRRQRRGQVFRVEVLEDRQLLAAAAATSVWPSLSGLIQQAFHGQDTSKAAIDKMLKALQTQLTNGPLADLKAGTVTGDGFVTEVQTVVADFSQNVNQQLLPHFKNIDEMLNLQALRMYDTMSALNQINTVGLSTATDSVTQAQTVINSLTSGPIFSLGTPLSGYVTTTQIFENQLNSLSNELGTSGTTLTPADAVVTLQAEAEAYRSTMMAGLLITHSDYASTVNTAVDTFESATSGIGSETAAIAQSDLNRAIVAFDTAILDTSGLFGSSGVAGLANSKFGYLPHDVATGRLASTFSNVSGTATFGDTATLTATLASSSGTPVAGQTVNFTLDGAYAGTAVTDSTGLATLSGVPTSATSGTSTGSVVVTFAGSSSNRAAAGSGDLVVSQGATTTTLTSSANPSGAGNSVTFTATVAPTTGTGTPTGTVTFLDGTTTLGTGTLNSSGVATFSTSTSTPLTVGTHSITAKYDGDSNFTGSTSTALSQVVNPATTTTLSSSANPSVSGQPVTFTATVAPSTGTGTPTGTVTFMDGTATLGTGTLNSSGVATLTIPNTTTTTPLSVGTHSVTAVYGGSTSFGSSTSTAVSQVVDQATTSTALTSLPNPSSFQQTVTLTATVTTTSPGVGTPTGTVTFMDGSTALSTQTLNTSGVATFATSTLGVATHSITAVYNGDTNHKTSTSSAASQVVNPANTALSAVANSPSINTTPVPATTTLSATLTNTSVSQPISGQNVNFVVTHNGTTIVSGSGLTGSNGVASVSVSTTGMAVGDTITASFAANTDYNAAPNANGTIS